MPYHGVALGKSWNELSYNMQISFIGIMRLVGGCFITISMAILSILIVPYRKGEKWAKYTIPILEIICCLFILNAAMVIKLNTESNPPVIIPIIAIFLIILSFVVSIKDK